MARISSTPWNPREQRTEQLVSRDHLPCFSLAIGPRLCVQWMKSSQCLYNSCIGLVFGSTSHTSANNFSMSMSRSRAPHWAATVGVRLCACMRWIRTVRHLAATRPNARCQAPRTEFVIHTGLIDEADINLFSAGEQVGRQLAPRCPRATPVAIGMARNYSGFVSTVG